MNGKREQRKCISYFDLLGTKAAAQQSEKQYELLIQNFRLAVDGATNEFAPSKDKIWIFSDCAYVQTASADKMFSFYHKLRDCLFAENIYFTAAMDIGELKTLSPLSCTQNTKHERSAIQGNNVENCSSTSQQGTFFVGPDTTRIYAQQSALSGIGVTCGQKLLSTYREQLCLSYYYNTRDCSEIVSFWDLKYESPSIILLESLIAQLVKTRFENLRASRYYLTAIVSLLKSYDMAKLTEDELWEIVACCCLQNSFFTKIKGSFKNEINVFVVVILQLLLDNANRIDNIRAKMRRVVSIAELEVSEVIALYHDNLIRQVIEPGKQSVLLDKLILLRSNN